MSKIEAEPQIPEPERQKSKVELSEALEILGELENSSSQLKADSTSFSVFVEAVHKGITNLRKEVNESLALGGLDRSNYKLSFENYVQEVRHLVELMREVDSTIKSLQGKTSQLGNLTGIETMPKQIPWE